MGNGEEYVFHKENLRIGGVTTFETSNSVSTEYDDGNNQDSSFCNTIANLSSAGTKDLITLVKSAEDVQIKTLMEESVEPVRRVSFNDANEVHNVTYSCESCSYQCESKSSLKRHVRVEHEHVRYS